MSQHLFDNSPAFRRTLISRMLDEASGYSSAPKEAAGGVVVDSAGRILLREPTKHFGGYCVPLDTRILTRRGVLTHQQVRVGDETIGYDPSAAVARWTKVTKVHRYASKPLVSYGSPKLIQVRCTPNHRWLVDTNGTLAMAEAASPRPKRMKTVFAVPHADDRGASDVTPDEAALLAWIVTDGSWVKVKRTAFECCIGQLKPAGVADIDALLSRLAFTHSRTTDYGGMVRYRLAAHCVRRLVERTGYTGDKAALPAFVLRLTTAAVHAFLAAAYLAEGAQTDGKRACLWQNEGPCLAALQIAAYRCGKLPAVRETNKETVNQKVIKAGGTLRLKKLSLLRPRIRDVVVTEAEAEPVWCVTTELGTWTMQQGAYLCLTGNSWTFPKGTVDAKEELMDAAVREVQEETGVTAKVWKRLGKYIGTTSYTTMYLMRPTKIAKEHDHETQKVDWFTPTEAASRIAETTTASGRRRDLTILKDAIVLHPALLDPKALKMIGNLMSKRIIE